MNSTELMYLSEQGDGQFQASIIVTCKGRFQHLRRTLPTMLAQDFFPNYEIVIVDYGCSERTFDSLRLLDLHQIQAIQVENETEEFSRSRSHNIGGRCAESPLLAFVDADIRLHPEWLSVATQPFEDEGVGIVTVDRCYSRRDRLGTCIVSQSLFHKVRGYDEQFVGWGYEDNDFYRRCRLKACMGHYDGKLLRPIAHKDDLRFQFHAMQFRKRCLKINKARARERTELSDQTQYGVGEVKKFRGKVKARFQHAREAAQYLDRHLAHLIVGREANK